MKQGASFRNNNEEERERRRAIIKKAELENQLAEKELQQWRKAQQKNNFEFSNLDISEIKGEQSWNGTAKFAQKLSELDTQMQQIEERQKIRHLNKFEDMQKEIKKITTHTQLKALEAEILDLHTDRKNSKSASPKKTPQNRKVSKAPRRLSNDGNKENSKQKLQTSPSLRAANRAKMRLQKQVQTKKCKELEKQVDFWKNKAQKIQSKFSVTLKRFQKQFKDIRVENLKQLKQLKQEFDSTVMLIKARYETEIVKLTKHWKDLINS